MGLDANSIQELKITAAILEKGQIQQLHLRIGGIPKHIPHLQNFQSNVIWTVRLQRVYGVFVTFQKLTSY